MTQEEIVILGRVLAALVVGAAIGFERTFHGRPAGFRTHSLVCLASSLADAGDGLPEPMDDRRSTRCYPNRPHAHGPGHHDGHRFSRCRCDLQGRPDRSWTDDRRIHLDHGRHRHSDRDRVLFCCHPRRSSDTRDPGGIRFIELRLPTEFYAHHSLIFERGAAMAEDDLRRLIGEHGFSIANLSYHLSPGGKLFEYGMVMKSRERRNAEALSRHLSNCRKCSNSGSTRGD